MSERDEMAERIRSAQEGGAGRESTVEPVVEGKVYTFRCRIGPSAAIYKPWDSLEPGKRQTYGFLMELQYLPDHLKPYVKWSGRSPVLGIGGGRTAPIVVPEEPSRPPLHTIHQCALAANLALDDLLVGASAEVAVRPTSYGLRNSLLHDTEIAKRLTVMAIRVRTEDLVQRYDALCAKYFTGG